MNDSDYNPLQEKSWRRKLTPAEAAELQEWLEKHPETQADWDTEVHLTDAINRLPDAQMPSNFTVRVLQAVERESAVEVHWSVPTVWRFLRSLVPRAAIAGVVLGVAAVSYHRYTIKERRAELARMVATLPSPQVLQDFDTIQKMGSVTAGPDGELLALMK
jgi:anti-sigma factor RsiW